MDREWDEYCEYIDSKRYQEAYEAELAERAALMWEDEDESWDAPAEDPDDESWRYVDDIDYAHGL